MKVFKEENLDDRNKFEKHFKFHEFENIITNIVHDRLEPIREQLKKINDA